MPKTKQFIDKKHSVTFNLVHRSQQDPLIVDENAPQRVLQQVPQKNKKTSNNKDELKKWGILYDDDYDYMQHLKQPGRNTVSWEQSYSNNQMKHKNRARDTSKPVEPSLNLPSSVFASEFEEDEGLLRRAAPIPGPRPDLDPDVVAGLDEDFNFSDPDNILEDDFIQKAMATDSECSDIDEENCSSNYSEDEMYDEVGSLNSGKFSFRDEETKSRFTEYSMSSSVMKRNDQLSLLDSRFEKLYGDYSDTEIGPLDCDEIEGEVRADSDILLQYAEEFQKAQMNEKLDNLQNKELIKCRDLYSDSEDELVTMKVDDPKKDWDCESILSTYSTLYNHPRLIDEPKIPKKIKINSRTGIPVIDSGINKLTIKSLAKFNDMNAPNEQSDNPKSVCAESIMSTLSVLSIRPKNETPEERNQRKKLLKEYRQERRIERKANTEAFKMEKKRQEKILINNRSNVQGNKIL